MVPWLLQKIGVGKEFVSHLNETTVSFQHWEVLFVGLALLVPVGIFIYRRQRSNLASVPPGLRAALTATRVLVLGLLVVVLAGPYLKLDYEQEKKPIVAFMFDQSQSMALPIEHFNDEHEVSSLARAAGYLVQDGRIDPQMRQAFAHRSRAKWMQEVTQRQAAEALRPLSKNFDVRYYAFSREAKPLPVDSAEPKLPDPPAEGGPATYIGDAVDRVFDDAAGRPVAGIVLFTDGQNTGGRSPAEAARAAGAAGTPIFAILPPGSQAPLKDVAIVDVSSAGQVALGDTARVSVTIESQGFDKRPVKVELRENGAILDSRDLVLNSAEQQQVDLSFQATTAGNHYLTVQVPPLPEESEALQANNRDGTLVRVSKDKLKVLYVEGVPRWDFRFLKNAIRRDHGLAGRTSASPDIVIEAEWRRQAPAQQRSALPRTLKDLAEYHTVILGDTSPQILDSEFVELLVQAVRERGLGLIVEAGPLAMPHRFDERLKNLLPIRVEPGRPGMEPGVRSRPFRLELTPDGSVLDALRFNDDPGRNEAAWSYLPPFYWCIAAERAAPGASVLAWEPHYANRFGKLPLIAEQYAGKGRVMLVGTDSTWLWRQNVGDRFFYKFWGQSIRFVARRDESETQKTRLEVQPARAQPGETAQVELMAFHADGVPWTEPGLTVQVNDGNAVQDLELTADSATPGRYVGKYKLSNSGSYRFAYDPGAGQAKADAQVRVLLAPEEYRHPNVNRPALEQIAGASAHGRVLELADLASIGDDLKGTVELKRAQQEASLWDNWLLLVILVGIYSLDVGLRRLAGLS